MPVSKIYVVCGLCQGNKTIIPPHNDGEPLPEPITCPDCNGLGVKLFGYLKEE